MTMRLFMLLTTSAAALPSGPQPEVGMVAFRPMANTTTGADNATPKRDEVFVVDFATMGQFSHFYHFVHDALLPFHELYISRAGSEETRIRRVAICGSARNGVARLADHPMIRRRKEGLGQFRAIFEAVYNVEVVAKNDPIDYCAACVRKKMEHRSLAARSAKARSHHHHHAQGNTTTKNMQNMMRRMGAITTSSLKVKEQCTLVDSGVDYMVNKKNALSRQEWASLWPVAFDDAIAFVKRAVLGTTATGEAEDIVLIRRDEGADRRHIANFAELEAGLTARFGGERRVVVLGAGVSFDDQMRAFEQARVVIGAHGAGLTNVFWMSPHSGRLVIEISPRMEDMYHFISTAGGHRYIYDNYGAQDGRAAPSKVAIRFHHGRVTRLSLTAARRRLSNKQYTFIAQMQ